MTEFSVHIRSAMFVVVTAMICSGGCTEPNPAYSPGPELPDECRAGSEVSETFEDFERPEKVDLWFVVSNTEAAEDYQEALADAVDPFLQRIEGREYDVRVGVSTMDATTGAGLAPVIGGPEGCEENVQPVAKSGDGDWIQSVECNLQQGADGDRRVRPLDKMAETLADSGSVDGFFRDDARLVSVLVTNVDDCSGDQFSDDPETPVRDLCAWQSDDLRGVDAWLDDVREDAAVPEGFSMAVVAGPPTEVSYQEGESVRRVCSSGLGSGYPSPRLDEAADDFGSQGIFESICVLDFHGILDRIARRLVFQDQITLCASESMAHEPLEVVGVDEDGESQQIPFGAEFVFVGTTDACPQGAIRINRSGTEQIDRVEMTYCGL